MSTPHVPQHLQPVEETYTTWYNPLDHDQYVDIRHGNERLPRRYYFKPGQSMQVPSRFDHVFHVLSADGKQVVGGQAPQLRREGQTYGIDPVLDPKAAERAAAEAIMAAEQLKIQAAELALVRAASVAAKNEKKSTK